MAQSDFDIYSGTVSFTGGPEGTSALHSLFSSPLTTEGTYCRAFTAASTAAGRAAASFRVKSSFASGTLVGIPNTKALSIRAYLRLPFISGQGYNGVAITCKGLIGNSSVPTGNDFSTTKGYHLSLQCPNNSPANQLNLHYADGTGIVLISGLATDSWHKVRMDVIPINGNEGDKIMIYTGTGATGSETWTLISSQTVLATTSKYISWNDASAKHTGFAINHGATNQQAYIDRFQVLLVNA